MKNPDEVIAMIRNLNLAQINKQLQQDKNYISNNIHLPARGSDFNIVEFRVNGFIAFLEAASNQPRE